MSDIFDHMFDSYDDERDPEPYEPKPVTCKYCKKKGLYWKEVGAKFVLVTQDNERHVCAHRMPITEL